MLIYEKVNYNDMKDSCSCEDIEFLIDLNKKAIQRYSEKTKIPICDIEKQVRLHAPQFEKRKYRSGYFWSKHIVPILDTIFSEYPSDFDDYVSKSGSYLFSTEDQVKRIEHLGVISLDRQRDAPLDLHINTVSEEIGKQIESKLHYLRSFRSEAVVRYGLFVKGFHYPICYASFCQVDRQEKITALKKAINKKEIDENEVIELSRLYGCGSLPKNTISLFLGYIAKQLNQMQYKYLITAVNITLGFTGGSVLASGFIPYALRPVGYFYKKNNCYCSRRTATGSNHRNTTSMPPNILYVKELGKRNGKKLTFSRPVEISRELEFFETTIEHEIYEIREELESVWSEKSRYHGTVISNLGDARKSKGQCGVSSLLLARRLESKGYNTLFCEGNLLYKNDSYSIYNHCWIKVVGYNRRKQNVVIDITADQNGYHRKIIFSVEEDLKDSGIRYETTSEIEPKQVDVLHLLERLDYLEKELSGKNRV